MVNFFNINTITVPIYIKFKRLEKSWLDDVQVPRSDLNLITQIYIDKYTNNKHWKYHIYIRVF